MSGFGTDSATLDALAKRIMDVDEQAQAKLRAVRSAAETVQASWKGSAATAFQNLIARFDEDGRKVSEALREISAQIASSAEVYQRNEDEQESAVSNVSSRLG